MNGLTADGAYNSRIHLNLEWSWYAMKKIVLIRHGQSLWNVENKFTGWTDVDLSDDAIPSSLWCEYLTPISCDVTYNDTHTCSYSYFEPREEKHYILDWADYRIDGRLEPSIMPDGEVYIHNWTLTYIFTDADYEYAVANGNIR